LLGKLGLENCSEPKRSLGDFSNQDYKSASKDCVVALRKLHSWVLAVLDESEKWDTLRKYDLVPSNMNNPNCELVVG